MGVEVGERSRGLFWGGGVFKGFKKGGNRSCGFGELFW